MNIRALIPLLAVMAGCSSPRYTYDFGQPQTAPVNQPTFAMSSIPPPPSEDSLVEVRTEPRVEASPNQSKLAKPQVSKGEKRKIQSKNLTGAPGPKPELADLADLDVNLKRSVIFFAGGVIFLLIGGDILVVIGSLSLLIGLIFGLKWLLSE